jgi:hypothetical protein
MRPASRIGLRSRAGLSSCAAPMAAALPWEWGERGLTGWIDRKRQASRPA